MCFYLVPKEWSRVQRNGLIEGAKIKRQSPPFFKGVGKGHE